MTAGRAALTWGLLGFAGFQLMLGCVADRWWPELRHPEYGRKLALLDRQTVQHDGEPLLLALGTSRTAFGFLAHSSGDEIGWQFNFGLTGVGPVQELICLRRLTRRGIRPDTVLIEIHPPFLHQTPGWCESRGVDVRKLDASDLAVMCRYAFEPRELAWRWAMSRLSPWYAYRVELLRRFAPDWLEEASRRDERMLGQTDARGWSRYPVRPSDDAERERLARLCADLYRAPMADFEVSNVARRAIDEMLAICREHQIEAALVMMPEGQSFRGRYSPRALSRLKHYLAGLRRTAGVRIFDCRQWCDDTQFCDGQHLLPEGALAFSNRLSDELLAPWLAEHGRPHAEIARRTGAEHH